MPTDQQLFTLYLKIDPPADADPDQVDRLARQLHRDLKELEVGSVEPARDAAVPSGAKGAEAVTLGSLAVVLLPTLIPKMIEFLQSWLSRGENRNVKMKLQVKDNFVEVEYSPRAISPSEIELLVTKLTGAMKKGAS